jgi:hypothetical protein
MREEDGGVETPNAYNMSGVCQQTDVCKEQTETR